MPTSSFIAPCIATDFSNEWSKPELLFIGEYNAIYVATRYGKRYVLKALRSEYQDSIPHQKLLRKEFQLGLPLEHTNIVHTLDWGQREDIGNFIQLEYIDGVTLSQFLETQPKPKVRQQILCELLAGVEYLHQHQVIHRDIKPSNILITRNGHHVKLIDLGVSDADDYVALKQPAGSFTFIAPEQLAGEVLDGRADIYSIGKVMKRLLPWRYFLITRKCTASKREKRFASCSQLQKAIRQSDVRRIGIPIVAIICLMVSMGYYWHREDNRSQQQKTEQALTTIHVLQNELERQSQTNQQKMDSLNHIIEQDQANAEDMKKNIIEMEKNRPPTPEEERAYRRQYEQKLYKKYQEIWEALNSGEINCKDTSIMQAFEQWKDEELNNAPNSFYRDINNEYYLVEFYIWQVLESIDTLPPCTDE